MTVRAEFEALLDRNATSDEVRNYCRMRRAELVFALTLSEAFETAYLNQLDGTGLNRALATRNGGSGD